jgi:hypothetical protein
VFKTISIGDGGGNGRALDGFVHGRSLGSSDQWDRLLWPGYSGKAGVGFPLPAQGGFSANA